MADGSIIIDTKLDTKDLGKQLKNLSKELKEGVAAAGKVANVALAGIGASIAGIAAASKKFADTTDRIDKMSQAVGLSRKVFQELDYTFSQNGASMDSLQMGMRTLLQQANDNSVAFSQLGVSVRNADGSLRSQDEILKDTIRGFERMENGQGKAILAQELFGRSAQELMPTLNQAAGSMDTLSMRANDLGIVLTDQAINSGVKLADTMDDLTRSMGGIMNSAIEPMIPLITDAANKFVQWATEGNKLGEIMKTVANTIISAWNSGVIQAITAGVVAIKAVSVAFGIMNAVMAANPIVLIVAGIVAAIGALVAAVILIHKNWNTISTFFLVTLEKIKTAFVILGSKIGEAMTVAFNGAKIAVISLVQTIVNKLFNSFLSLLSIIEKLDFAGVLKAQTGAARDFIGKMSDGLNGLADDAKAESQAAITAAREKQDATERATRENLARYMEEKNAREENIEVAQKEADGVIKAQGEIIVSSQEMAQDMGATAEQGVFNMGQAFRKGAESLAVKAFDMMKKIGSVVGQGFSVLKNITAKAFSFLGALARFDSNAMLASLKELLDGLQNFFMNEIALSPIWVKTGIDMISAFLKGMMKNLPVIAETVKNALISISKMIIAYAPDMLTTAGIIIIELAKGLVDAAPALIDAALTVVVGLSKYILDNLPEIILLGIKLVIALIEGIAEALPMIIYALTDAFPDILNAIIDALPLIARAIVDNLPQIIEAFMYMIPMLIAALIAAYPELWLAMIQVGVELIFGLMEGITAALKGLGRGTWQVLWDYIITPIKELFGIHSPSTVFADLGWQMIQGLINGILNAGAGIWNAISGVFTGIADSIGDALGGATDFITGGTIKMPSGKGKGKGKGLAGHVDDALKAAGKGVSDAGKAIGEFFGFASGSPYIEKDQFAQIHKGERIVPRTFNQDLISGNTMMLAPQALATIMSSMPQSAPQAQRISIQGTVPVTIDGREIGRAAFEWIDTMAGGAYGY